MSFSEQDIIKIANLACLEISQNTSNKSIHSDEKSMDDIKNYLNNVLKLVKEINNIDTSKIEPMSHSIDKSYQRLRSDKITEKNIKNKIKINNIINNTRLYLVPKVVDN